MVLLTAIDNSLHKIRIEYFLHLYSSPFLDELVVELSVVKNLRDFIRFKDFFERFDADFSCVDDVLSVFVPDLKHDELLAREVETLRLGVHPQNCLAFAISFAFLYRRCLDIIQWTVLPYESDRAHCK